MVFCVGGRTNVPWMVTPRIDRRGNDFDTSISVACVNERAEHAPPVQTHIQQLVAKAQGEDKHLQMTRVARMSINVYQQRTTIREEKLKLLALEQA